MTTQETTETQKVIVCYSCSNQYSESPISGLCQACFDDATRCEHCGTEGAISLPAKFYDVRE